MGKVDKCLYGLLTRKIKRKEEVRDMGLKLCKYNMEGVNERFLCLIVYKGIYFFLMFVVFC